MALGEHAENHQTAAGAVGGGAGGKGNDFGGILKGCFIQDPDPGSQAHAALTAASEEGEHRIHGISHSIQAAFIGVRIRHGKEGDVKHLVPCDHHAVPVGAEIVFVLKGVQAAEHGPVVHMVAVQQIVGVAEIPAVAGGQVDGAGEGAVLVDIVRGVVQVVGALHDGIVDAGVVDGQPGPVILIDLRQSQGVQRCLIVVKDFRLVLLQIPDGGSRPDLGMKGIIEHISGIHDKDSSKKARHKGNQTASAHDRTVNDRFCHFLCR